MTLTLDTLFAPCGGKAFLEDILGKASIYVPGVYGKFTGVASWAVVNQLLEFGGLSFPRLRLVRGSEDVPQEAYFRAGVSGYQRPWASGMIAELRAGATLVIESIEEIQQPVSALCETLESRLLVPIQADLYAQWQDRPAAPLRFNEHDVIILQIEGKRDWRVYRSTGRLPPGASGPNPAMKPIGEPVWNGSLQGGDLLYVPRGWWYYDEPMAEDAMCVALKFRNPTGNDVISRLIARLASSTRMNMDIPRFSGPQEHSGFLSYIQGELTEAATSPGVLLGFLAETRMISQPRGRFCFPRSAHAVSLPPSSDFLVTPLIRFPKSGDLRHLEFEDSFEMFVDGRRVRFGEEMAGVIRNIRGRDCVTVKALLDGCVAEMPQESVLRCLADLVQEGLLCLRDPTAAGSTYIEPAKE